MRYTEKDVAKLVADVEKAFTAHLAKAEDMSLAKSEDGEKDHEDKHEDKPEHDEKPEHEAKEEHHEEGEKHAPEGEKHEEHEGHDYDEEDMAHMEKMYRSMSKGELAAHHGCIQKCMGGDAGMSKAEIESCEPKNTPGAKSPASKAEGMQMNKADGCGGEMSASNPKGSPGAKSPASTEQDNLSKEMAKTETGKIESCEPGKTPGAKSPASTAEGMQMEKSEKTEVELLKSELETQKKNFEAVQEFLTKLVKKTAPQGKAITSLDVVAKSEMPSKDESLSKGQIHEILKTKSSDPSLKKSDRDAITTYYLNGQVNVNSISHLLK
jgi:hypothetical protein